jgi:DNA-binding response OmpR family regulator
MKALLKRSGAKSAAAETYVFGGLRVDCSARLVSIDGAEASLTPKELTC